jgi:hypothetical protein
MTVNAKPTLLSLKSVLSMLLLICGMFCMAHAKEPNQLAQRTYELGQPFPQAINRSLNPQWRVYVFEREGVRYFQINDLFGHVRATFAAENGSFLILPAGEDTDRVVVPREHENDALACGTGCVANAPQGDTSYISAPYAPNNFESKCGAGCSGHQNNAVNERSSLMKPCSAAGCSVNRIQKCNSGCSVQRIIMNGVVSPDSAEAAGNVIYQDGTLQIIATEDANHQPVWQVVALPQ